MISRRACRLIACLAAACCGLARAESVSASGADETPPELSAFLGRLAAAGAGTRTLRADFVQRKLLGMFKTEVVTRGRLWFARPDRLRWETFEPDASVLLARADRAELRLPGERPRLLDLKRDRSLGALVGQMMAWLGVSPQQGLSQEHAVDLRKVKDGTQLRLTPRGELGKQLYRIELMFDGEPFLRRVKLLQRDGDVTEIEIGRQQRNFSLPAELFGQ